MARKCLRARVQVTGRRMCFLPVGSLPGAHHTILLTAHVLSLCHMLGYGGSKVSVVSMEITKLCKAIISHEVPTFYGRLTSSGSYCTSRKLSTAVPPFLTLLLCIFEGPVQPGHSLRQKWKDQRGKHLSSDSIEQVTGLETAEESDSITNTGPRAHRGKKRKAGSLFYLTLYPQH